MENMKNKIITSAIKYAKFKPESITENTKFEEDLGYDSVRLVSFIIELEDNYEIEFDDSILSNLLNLDIKAIINYIEKRETKK